MTLNGHYAFCFEIHAFSEPTTKISARLSCWVMTTAACCKTPCFFFARWLISTDVIVSSKPRRQNGELGNPRTTRVPGRLWWRHREAMRHLQVLACCLHEKNGKRTDGRRLSRTHQSIIRRHCDSTWGCMRSVSAIDSASWQYTTCSVHLLVFTLACFRAHRQLAGHVQFYRVELRPALCLQANVSLRPWRPAAHSSLFTIRK